MVRYPTKLAKQTQREGSDGNFGRYRPHAGRFKRYCFQGAERHDNHITLETDLDGSELFEVSLAELTPTKPTDEAADTTVGTAGTSIAGMLCEGRFALYLAGEPYKSGLKAQGCGKLKKAVFSIELDPDEEEAEE